MDTEQIIDLKEDTRYFMDKFIEVTEKSKTVEHFKQAQNFKDRLNAILDVYFIDKMRDNLSKEDFIYFFATNSTFN